MKEDYLKVDTPALMKELRDFSDQYNYWYSALLKRENDLKLYNAELYLGYKQKGEKITQKEIDSLILTNDEYKVKKNHLTESQSFYLQAKTQYNNKQTEISLLQSELKRELTFVSKESR
tara:strand:- start:469 stop:825 length:357 start_codon:yes stop_codon:yes gene_type:complete